MIFLHGIGRDGLALALIVTPSTLVVLVWCSNYLSRTPVLLAEFMRQWVPRSGLYVMMSAFCSTVQLLLFPGSLMVLPPHLWFRELDWPALMRSFYPDVAVDDSDEFAMVFHCRPGLRIFAERVSDTHFQIVTGVLYSTRERGGLIGRLFDDALFLRLEFSADVLEMVDEEMIEFTVSS